MNAITITQIDQTELEIIIQESVGRAISSILESNTNLRASKALNIKEASAYTQCAVSTLRKAFREKRLKGHRQAGKLYFFEEDIINWIKS